MSARDGHPATARLAGRVAITFGALLHLVVGAFVLASTQILDGLVVLGLAALWGTLAGLGWHWRHRRPPLVLALPFIAAAAWWVAARLAG
jgi:hypothetical protein